jgi:plastocyanin
VRLDRRRRLALAGLAVAATAVAAVAVPALARPGAAPAAAKQKVVDVGDEYFMPTSLKVRKGTRVRWVWRGTEDHDVTLRKGPKGVKRNRWRSPATSVTGFPWSRTFKIRGTYNFWCTLHPTLMKMTVTVRK